ncbi:alpha-ketoglutarate-dependent dioxygenase AlkB [Methyloligella sp. 2.7D]|uniref:alpha-ketoglutarate-dependent dioxygenase AlkB family protein n=1 Tax=unclassified Methyloligella TaxID=2625955 RepID=UPI00157D0A6E|nr:alpha-ketoglutarate-dependent dioxygenase AlkB [Methyloligella sp. GL2]QKP76162.1 alpha-ketoglutarate-dependent dioxygenase AlkB [Methyloligella sp. GL2]
MSLDHFAQRLDDNAQRTLLAELRDAVAQAPFYTPTMPRTGKPMSVKMTNCGSLGWLTDKEKGYRYEPVHPVTGKPWPPIPALLLRLWDELSGYPAPPEACLVNYYAKGTKLGLHRDEDEQTFDAPVLSVSLGDTALFRIGGLKRRDPTRRIELKSGDVFLMGGEDRLTYHGIDRIVPGSSSLLPKGGRINLTLRRVTPA